MNWRLSCCSVLFIAIFSFSLHAMTEQIVIKDKKEKTKIYERKQEEVEIKTKLHQLWRKFAVCPLVKKGSLCFGKKAYIANGLKNPKSCNCVCFPFDAEKSKRETIVRYSVKKQEAIETGIRSLAGYHRSEKAIKNKMRPKLYLLSIFISKNGDVSKLRTTPFYDIPKDLEEMFCNYVLQLPKGQEEPLYSYCNAFIKGKI